jgi:hypothetical protein
MGHNEYEDRMFIVQGQNVRGQIVRGQYVRGQNVRGQFIRGQNVRGQYVRTQNVQDSLFEDRMFDQIASSWGTKTFCKILVHMP